MDLERNGPDPGKIPPAGGMQVEHGRTKHRLRRPWAIPSPSDDLRGCRGAFRPAHLSRNEHAAGSGSRAPRVSQERQDRALHCLFDAGTAGLAGRVLLCAHSAAVEPRGRGLLFDRRTPGDARRAASDRPRDDLGLVVLAGKPCGLVATGRPRHQGFSNQSGSAEAAGADRQRRLERCKCNACARHHDR